MFKYKKAYEEKVRELHNLKLEYKSVLQDYNKVDSELKEYKQTSLEDYLKLEESLENCEAILENEESNHCKLKCDYHKLNTKYKILLQKLSFLEKINENIVDIEKTNICKICYETIEFDKYKFSCPNDKCNKSFHVSCILKVNEEKRNECSYCKCDFQKFNYNFNYYDYFRRTFLNEFEENFSEYSDYNSSQIDYDKNYTRWMSQNYYFDYSEFKKKIEKIQKLICSYLKRKKKLEFINY